MTLGLEVVPCPILALFVKFITQVYKSSKPEVYMVAVCCLVMGSMNCSEAAIFCISQICIHKMRLALAIRNLGSTIRTLASSMLLAAGIL